MHVWMYEYGVWSVIMHYIHRALMRSGLNPFQVGSLLAPALTLECFVRGGYRLSKHAGARRASGAQSRTCLDVAAMRWRYAEVPEDLMYVYIIP